MIIVQLNVMHATETCLPCGAWPGGGTAAQKKAEKKKEKKEASKKGKENEHLEPHLDHLWCNKLWLIRFTLSHMHTESSSLWLLRSKVRHKMTQCCWSMAYLILNLLSSLSTLFGLWPLLYPAKWKATVGDRFSVCLLNQEEQEILCCIKDSQV